MVQVVFGGAQDFDALLYGERHPGTMQYLQNQVNSVMEMSRTLTDAGRQFFSTAQDLYDKFNSAEAMRLARAAVRRVGSIFQRDEIRSIWELGQLQNAPLTMQRWIMAEPTVRRMYHEQRCDGYSDTYVDNHPGQIGRDHYDYRRVMDGILVDSEEHDWKATVYFDDLLEGDRELTLDEKIDILSTWDVVASMMKEGSEDPTSAFGNKL